MREQYIRTDDGVQLFCRIAGRGIPILLIHGAMVDADFYIEVQEFLSKRYRVITYDKRGYSRSSPGEDYCFERQAKDAACVLRELTTKKAVVVGCSAGGLIALKLKELYPELVDRLIVHEPPIISFDGVLNDEMEGWLAGIYEKVKNRKIRQAVVDFALKNSEGADPRAKSLPPAMVQQQLDNGKVFIEKEYPEIFDKSSSSIAYRSLKDRDKITVLVGDSSGDTYAVRAAKALAEDLDTEICYVPGTHNGARDLPFEFSAMVMGILRFSEGDKR